MRPHRFLPAALIATVSFAAGSVASASTDTTAGSEDTAAGADSTAPSVTTDSAASATTLGEPSPDDTKEPITVGSADFSESQLLAQIYGQALEQAGFTVDYEMSIGSREAYYGAIESGEIDIVPEYTNSILTYVLRRDDPEALPDAANVDEQIEALGEALPDELTVLTPSEAEDKDTIVCNAEAASQYHLTDLSSLFEAAPDITIGGPPEFEERAFGISGFREQFGAEFAEFVPLGFSEVADALKAGQIDCGNMFSTSPVIATEGFVPLVDDLELVPAEAVLPLVRTDAVNPTLVQTLDAVDEALTTDVLTELLVKVDVDKEGVDVVAKEWLASLEP